MIDETSKTNNVNRVKIQTLWLLALSFVVAVLYWKVLVMNLSGNEIKNGAGIPAVVAPFLIFPLYSLREKAKKLNWLVAAIMAIVLGIFLGALSGFFEKNLNGIIIQSLLVSFCSAFCIIFMYKNGHIKVNDKFLDFTTKAISSLSLITLIDFIMSFIDLNWRSLYNTSSVIGIPLNFGVFALAYLIFSIDLNIIDTKIHEGKVDNDMTWSFAIELLTDVAWMYVACLFLLGRIRGRAKS